MEVWLLGIIVLLSGCVTALLVKVYVMQKSAREMEEAFTDRIRSDTNTLIDISSRDRYLCSLAASMNVQLKMLRKERRRYQKGDRQVKDAVTNISHDLRTPLTVICGYLDLLEEEEKLKPDRVESRGEIPSPVDIPPGCRFHGRCPYAEEICRREEPPMREVLPDHYVACHLAGGKNETKGRI